MKKLTKIPTMALKNSRRAYVLRGIQKKQEQKEK